MRKLIFLLSWSVTMFAQGQAGKDLLRSPFHTMNTFLSNVQPDSTNLDYAVLPFQYSGLDREAQEDAAIQLIQFLDGAGLYIELDELPKEYNYFDSTVNRHRYLIDKKYPNIYLSREDNKWIFNKKSIRAIDEAHGELFLFGSERLLQVLPRLGMKKYFGLYLYQYIGILFITLLGVVVHKMLSLIFNRIFEQLVKRSGYRNLAKGYLLPVARPVSWFAVVALARLFVPVLQLPPDLTHYILMGLGAVMPLFGTIVFYRLVNVLALYLEQMAEKTASSLDDQLVPLFRKTLKTFVVIIGTLFILDNLEIDILPLLTGLSIGGLAFALAAQDTIKNFFGSLMIFIDKPFQIGHWITSGDIDGTVEEVGFRSSRIRTFRNSVMYVPNSKLADSMIDNHGLRMYRRFYTQIAVTYDTPPEVLEQFVEGLRKIALSHPKTWKDNYHIYFNDMAAYSLNIMFYIFFDVPTWGEELRCRHEVLMEVMKLGKKMGIHFAFPTQTLHMENFPGQPSLSPSFDTKEGAEKKLKEYFKGT